MGEQARIYDMGRHGYFTMGLDSKVEWPSKEQSVRFRGHAITLRPETKDLALSDGFQNSKSTFTLGDAYSADERFKFAQVSHKFAHPSKQINDALPLSLHNQF